MNASTVVLMYWAVGQVSVPYLREQGQILAPNNPCQLTPQATFHLHSTVHSDCFLSSAANTRPQAVTGLEKTPSERSCGADIRSPCGSEWMGCDQLGTTVHTDNNIAYQCADAAGQWHLSCLVYWSGEVTSSVNLCMPLSQICCIVAVWATPWQRLGDSWAVWMNS